MVYGNPPFQHIGGGPLSKMNIIADASHRIDYPVQAKPKGLQDDFAVTVPPAAIDAMQRCITYRKEQRLTIPELLVHEFLRPRIKASALPPGATSLTETQMAMLVNFILQEHNLPKLREGDQTAVVRPYTTWLTSGPVCAIKSPKRPYTITYIILGCIQMKDQCTRCEH